MNESVSVSIYFYVDGVYTAITYDGVTEVRDLAGQIARTKADVAKMLDVPAERVKVITRKEYEEETDEADEDPDDMYDGWPEEIDE